MDTPTPGEPQTARGYESPQITQFSIFLDNRCGRLLDLLHTLERHHVRPVALAAMDAADHAVIRIVTPAADHTRHILQQAAFAFNEMPVLMVELGKEQTLRRLCLSLLGAELNIHLAYPLLGQHFGRSAVVLHCDDLTLAAEVLRRKQFNLLCEGDLEDTRLDDEPGESL